MRKTLIIVINSDVKTLNAVDPWTFVKNCTSAWEASKIVCLQVKAIVNPRVTIINIRICFLNSFLNLSPTFNELIIFLFIFYIKFLVFIKFCCKFRTNLCFRRRLCTKVIFVHGCLFFKQLFMGVLNSCLWVFFSVFP